MKTILGHDRVVQDMEGSYWRSLKILLYHQEQMSDMELCLIHYLLEVFLVFECRDFWYPTIDDSRENNT